VADPVIIAGAGPAGLQVLGSYLAARARPIPDEASFADWITNRFGRRLCEVFFKTYTEKVWGIPCETIAAEWAAQRIKGLSLRSAVSAMVTGRPGRIRTLIDRFDYPRLGPGMMWERVAEIVERKGGRVVLQATVVQVHHDGRRRRAPAPPRLPDRRVADRPGRGLPRQLDLRP
jgi:protoporphyrinogen oxidase